MGADIFENANNGQKKHNCFTPKADYNIRLLEL
jgi:hypothetical protein